MNVIVTGASKGIGRAVAERFAAAGANLVVCSRSETGLYGMMDELQTKYPDCTVRAKAADLSQPEDVAAFGKWILEKDLVPDILVNNAGQFLPGSIHNEPAGTLEQMIAVNLYSAYHLTRLLLPRMMEAKTGHIFNMCSIASLNAYANGGAYSISKFALLGFSKNLREEMKPYNIKVTAVLPGATMTASWEGSGIDPQRIMDPKDVAEMIYVASQLSPRAVVEDIVLRPQLGDL
ncbi:SDR family oxidoreductase [Segetibacter sp. 3557_3]|uniref:SDR family oxidoreductase n=1 Tax=Segetibacter sp. 3557_3 TaxID=2547429 RepID=UPI001058499F|nr:SDR family oxidoreductase [Segetibacter sp. 3557_3]TDH18352.1 SDR family oxidoreductase [Segetibacter sp. 3557_3]